MASYRAPKAREIDQSHNPMYAMAKEYVNTMKAIKESSTRDMFRETAVCVNDDSAREALKEYYMKDIFDSSDPRYADNMDTQNEAYEDAELYFGKFTVNETDIYFNTRLRMIGFCEKGEENIYLLSTSASAMEKFGNKTGMIISY